MAFAVAITTTCATSWADDLDKLSPYERDTIVRALMATKSELEPAPEGKTIESIEVRALDVLEDRDPLPGFLITFLNALHVTSRPGIIRQQVLFKEGDRYDPVLVEETARNLRGIRQISLVLVVPIKGSTSDRVRVLVITKDIWSLRPNSDFRIANDQLEYLLLSPSEENLAGLHHTASLRFELQPDTYSFGAGYKVPRLAGSWVEGSITTNFILNRDTGDLEGTFGSFSYGQPLFSTRAEWSWAGAIAWRSEVTRFFNGVEPLTFDAPSTPDDDAIPIEYDSEAIAGRIGFTRSFGTSVKHNLSVGAEASRSVYRSRNLDGLDPLVQREFADAQIPSGDKRIYPYVTYSTFTTNFGSYVDFETLGLQENYREGHDLYVKVYPVIEELGSARSFFGAAGGASLSARLGNGHLRFFTEGLVEAAPEQVYDANAIFGMRLTSPSFTIGRLIADGFVFQRFENFLNRRSTLGGEGRLRGYPSGAYRGENVFAYNLEFRSRPAELWTLQLGATAFYDVGAAWDRGENVDLRQSVGTGLRIVFPQLQRTAMRIDWAVPLELDPAVGVNTIFPGRFIVTFDQAFGLPTVDPPSVIN